MKDKKILDILMRAGCIDHDRKKQIIEKTPVIKQKLKQLHTINVDGNDIEHPITMIDVIASMRIPTPGKKFAVLGEEEIVELVSSGLGYPFKKIDPLKLDLDLVTKTIPHLFALKHLVVPVAISSGKLEVVMHNPGAKEIIEDIKKVSNMDIVPYMGTKADILKTVREFFGFKISIAAAESQINRPGFDLGNLEQYINLNSLNDIKSNDSHIKNAVEYLFHYAFDQRASDIHVEPGREKSKVRMRIDGILHTVYKLPKALHPAITSRIKTLSRLDIAEKRRPQDGRIKLSIENIEVEIRVSTVPVAFGEKIVLRILDPSVIFQDLKNLGFSRKDYKIYKTFLERSNGIILVTGPTGSGKSTTLYSSLGSIASEEKNITTIEDPIEMVYEGFNQIAVQPAVGITFASIIRNILRQDPDIIMVGEMRDQETAENGIQAALTGHLVFSTLHTNDAPSSVLRLVNMGIKSYLIAESIVGVVAQRLVRKICPYCRIKVDIEKEILEGLGIDLDQAKKKYGDDLKLRKGKGCIKCRKTGYLGRIGVFEIMPVTREIKEAIAESNDINTMAIRKLAVKGGMSSIQSDCVRKMFKGITTLNEVLRIKNM